MVVLGTKQEHFNAVWVKNEWSRFLSLVKESNGTKYLIPAYRDMDPYDLPDEFSHLQAQDMGKLGFMQDLIRGINKIIDVNVGVKTIERSTESNNVSPQIDSLLERAEIFLEDSDFVKASEYADRILDSQPQNAKAYLILLLSKYKVSSLEALCSKDINDLENDREYQRILRYGDDSIISQVTRCSERLKEKKAEQRRIELEKRKAETYADAVVLMESGDGDSLKKAEELFCSISDYQDSSEKALSCKKMYDEIINKAAAELKTINDSILNEAKAEIDELSNDINRLQEAISSIDSNVSNLTIEKDSLTGFFSIGKKKELERKIESLVREKSRIESSITEKKIILQNRQGRYSELNRQASEGVDLSTVFSKAGSIKVQVGCAGKVFKVVAQEGTNVSKGDVIIVLEAMKMEIPVVAPQNGYIATIDVEVGEPCEAGKTVATMN